MSLNLKLHKAQAHVFTNPAQFKLLIASRRFGKSRLLLTSIIHAALSYNQPIDPASPPVVLAGYPTLKQGRQVLWGPLVNLLEDSPLVKKIYRSDFRIQFKGNKPDILLRGANDNNGDGLRGLKLYFAGLDEIQDFNQAAWEEAIYPALADTPGSKSLLIGTPKGKAHWLYTNLYQKAINSAGWNYFHYTAYDNPFLPRSFIKRAKRELPERIFHQEFLAEFTIFEGQIFDCLCDHHLLDILPAHFDTVFLGLDHGSSNPCISVIGLNAGRYYILDSWSNPHAGKSVTVDQICEQAGRLATQYNAHRVYSPDDRPDIVISLRRWGDRHNIAGLKRAVITKRNNPSPMARAEIINTLFHQDRLFIPHRLQALIDDFRSYRRDTNAAGEVIDKIAPGQNDHTVDSVAYVLGQLEVKNHILAA